MKVPNAAYSQTFSYARDFGFAKDTAQALARLARYIDIGKLSPAERKKWTRFNVLDSTGKVMVESLDDLTDPVFWVLLGDIWEGYVERTVVGFK